MQLSDGKHIKNSSCSRVFLHSRVAGLSCDHGLDYASECENSINNVASCLFLRSAVRLQLSYVVGKSIRYQVLD